MQPETRKYLYDVSQACEALLEFIQNKNQNAKSKDVEIA